MAGTELTLIEYVEADPQAPRRESRALFGCACGNVVEKRVGNVAQGKLRNCADRSRHPDPRRIEAPACSTVHDRLEARFGRARDLPCAFCGERSGGNQWSYRHSSFEARSAIGNAKDRGQVYSIDPDDYWVLCRPHHVRYDRKHAEMVSPGQMSLVHVAFRAAYVPDYSSL